MSGSEPTENLPPPGTDPKTTSTEAADPPSETREHDPMSNEDQPTDTPTHHEPAQDDARRLPTEQVAAPTAPSPLQRHGTDVVAFLFGILFLATTALAFAVQARYLGGDDPRRGAWVAGTVLVSAGVVAVVGTLATGLRRSR